MILSSQLLDIQKAFNSQDITSIEMRERLRLCNEEYFRKNNKKTEKKDLNLPFVIVNKLSQTILAELSSTCSDDFFKMIYEKIEKRKKEIISKCLYSGSIILKPFINDLDEYDFIICERCNYIPCGRNSDGTLNEVIMAETKIIGPDFYTLLEKRKNLNKGCQIDYKLFKSQVPGSLGKQIKLQSLYPDLIDSFILPVSNLGLAEMKTPLLNDIDNSSEGIPVFEPALELIQLINENEAQLSDEFKLGQSRIFVDEGAFRKDETGRLILTDKVFSPVFNSEEPMTIFNPTLREASYLTRKNAYLRAIEDVIGLQRGILSDVENQEKSATEIGQTAAVYNLTIVDFQSFFNNSIQDFLFVSGEISKLYSLKNAKDYAGEVSLDFGDGVLYDRDRNFNELLKLVEMNLFKPEKFIAWYFSIDDSSPEGKRQIEELMPKIEEAFIKEGEE